MILTSFGRPRRLTERSAQAVAPARRARARRQHPRGPRGRGGSARRALGPGRRRAARDRVRARGRAGGNFLDTPAESAEVAFQTSAYSLKALRSRSPTCSPGGGVRRRARLRRFGRLAVLRLDGCGQGRTGGDLALPGARPRSARRAREPGVGGAAGDVAASGIPGFSGLADAAAQAPLGWDTDTASRSRGRSASCSVSRPGITGEILHVDGGFHAIGTALAPVAEEAVA